MSLEMLIPKNREEIDRMFNLFESKGDVNVENFMLMYYTESEEWREIAFKNRDTRKYLFIRETMK